MAMTIQGKIKDGSIKWNNAIRQDRYLTLSNWQIISGLYPTKEWKPGSFISVGGIKDGFITLSNGSSSVSIPFKVAGTQYRLGDAASKFAIQKSTGATFKVCKEHALNKNQAVVIGDEPCVSKEEYKSEIAYTPFHFVRPLLEVDDNKIKEAFSESSLTKGIYTGSVTITPMYMFKSPSGSWTYRTSSPIPLNVSINYPGSQILDFEVIGDGIIHPFYNIEPRTISGLTKYQVKFRGVFSEGSKINMKLLKPTSGKFQLLADNESIPEGKDKIPYSIKCKGDSCGDDFFVNFNGNMILDGGLSYLRTPKGGTNEISIDLEVAYKNIPKSSVDTGRYSNSFTIIFENEM
ncbi:hypothetical protein ACPV30_05000 [Photobacterium damselae]|uniref:hypothetical protein n=1 Tax=Photobacterium damselae TaxID=38293 RepID=UPI0040677D7E